MHIKTKPASSILGIANALVNNSNSKTASGEPHFNITNIVVDNEDNEDKTQSSEAKNDRFKNTSSLADSVDGLQQEYCHMNNGYGTGMTEIRSTPDRGRIMVARSLIPRGTFLFRIEPQAIVCDTENRMRRCGSCLTRLFSKKKQNYNHNKKDKELKKEEEKEQRSRVVECEGCGEIWYCSQACAERDWELLHAAECRFMKALYQGVPKVSDDINNIDGKNDKESAWMSTIGIPYQKAINRFMHELNDPYQQDYCRLLLRILTHRFHELLLTGDPLANQQQQQQQHWVNVTDPPYLTPADPSQAPKPVKYSEVEKLVANQESFPRARKEQEFKYIIEILDAFQAHLEMYYRPQQQQLRYQHHQKEKRAQVELNLTLAPLPKRLLQTELLDLIMREECNSFGLYEYPSSPPYSSLTNSGQGTIHNPKSCYALGLYIRHLIYGVNHSCSPNLLHVAHNSHLLFYTGRDIHPGEEINYTYLELGPNYRLPPRRHRHHDHSSDTARKESNLESEEKARWRDGKEASEKRRRFLKSHFYFDCGCARCRYEAEYFKEDKDDDDRVVEGKEERYLREGMSCGYQGCFGFYAPPVVLQARHSMNEDGVDETLLDDKTDRWRCVACGYVQP
ncbi:hypothetical protein FBU30_005935 [Linnemannia zychae]|nr:hypothetical protein FBU30_005935 [Linnemannia zychae]